MYAVVKPRDPNFSLLVTTHSRYRRRQINRQTRDNISWQYPDIASTERITKPMAPKFCNVDTTEPQPARSELHNPGRRTLRCPWDMMAMSSLSRDYRLQKSRAAFWFSVLVLLNFSCSPYKRKAGWGQLHHRVGHCQWYGMGPPNG